MPLIDQNGDYAVDVLNEAYAHHGTPEIINTDQGSQFTALEFVQTVKNPGCRLSMNGRAPGETTFLLNAYGEP